MSLSTSKASYADCFEIFDKAIEDGEGARVKMKDQGQAIYMRTRMHMARTLDRQINGTIYERGDAKYNTSVYDGWVCRIKQIGGEYYLYVERVDRDLAQIESLSKVEGLTRIEYREEPIEVEHREVKALPKPTRRI